MTSRSAAMLATRTSGEHITHINLPHREPGKNVRKKLLVKIFAGPIWEKRLVEFVGVFTKRRDEFKFALSVHASTGVDAVKLELKDVHEVTADMSEKCVIPMDFLSVEVLKTCIRMNVMLELFAEFVSPQQRELAAKVKGKGGVMALRSKEAMEKLASDECEITAPFGSKKGRGPRINPIELEQEIKGDPNKAIEKNAKDFDRKFEDEKTYIDLQADRIILAMKEGPHDRVQDPVRRANGPNHCMTHDSPFTSGYPSHLEGHGKWL
jgi:hypothetical protein